MREPDAGIAGGALDHRAAGLEHPAPLGIEHDPFGRPVLDRTAGIHEFGFTQDLAAGFLAQSLEPNQRSVADRADESIAHSHLDPSVLHVIVAGRPFGGIRPIKASPDEPGM